MHRGNQNFCCSNLQTPVTHSSRILCFIFHPTHLPFIYSFGAAILPWKNDTELAQPGRRELLNLSEGVQGLVVDTTGDTKVISQCSSQDGTLI
jgi:hypothetical protein